MKPARQKLTLLITALLGLASAVAEPAPPKAGAARRVSTVEGTPPKLTIKATGMVNTGGWTRPALRPVKEDAADGVLVFEFVAHPPTGPATQAFAKIKATLTMDKPAYREIKVVARRNSQTAK